MTLLIYPVISFLLSVLTIPIFGKLAYRYGIVDKPNGELKPHEKITPYLGGIAIYLAVILVTPFEIISKASLTLLMLTGLIDDVKNLSPKTRLIIEFIVASLLTYKYIGISWLSLAYIFVAVVLINAVNMMDGMDGVCAGVSIVSAIGLSFSVSSKFDAILLLSLIGALFGYFIYNFPPARIFMGDSGSYLIGGILSVGLLSAFRHGPSQISYVISSFIFTSLFFFDLSSGVLRRILNHRPPFGGDREHVYDKIYGRFKDKRKTLYVMLLIQIIAFLFGYYTKSNNFLSIVAILIMIVLYSILGKILEILRY
ncbi:MAG: glycosyltransferase family 4 protein [Fervidobacterium sp.]